MSVTMITLRWVTDSDPISAAIRDFEYGFWASHNEVLMPDGTLLGAHYDGGVLARSKDYDKGKFARELYVPILVSQAMADKFHTFLRSQINKPYDTKAIAGIVLQRNWREPDSWFCSELVAAALADCSYWPSRLADDFNHITPRDTLLIVSSRVTVPMESLS